jgi:hypothetical protein
MPSERHIQAIDHIPDRVPRRCARCRRWKPRDEFARNKSKHDGFHTYCKQCLRIAAHTRYHEGGGKAAKAEYLARPDVKERRKEYEKARRGERRRASNLAYAATARGKLVLGRSKARSQLRRATDPGRRAAIEARIALFDRELARLDAARELAAEPEPRVRAPRVRKGGGSPMRGVYITENGTYAVKVGIGSGKSVSGGTHKTLEAARDAANRLGLELLGINEYAVPKRRRA